MNYMDVNLLFQRFKWMNNECQWKYDIQLKFHGFGVHFHFHAVFFFSFSICTWCIWFWTVTNRANSDHFLYKQQINTCTMQSHWNTQKELARIGMELNWLKLRLTGMTRIITKSESNLSNFFVSFLMDYCFLVLPIQFCQLQLNTYATNV